jgi:pyruvate kinase
LIALSIYNTVDALRPATLITPTLSGSTTRHFNRYRLPVWIIAISPNEATCQNLQFSYGVYPIYEPQRPDDWVTYARAWLEQHGLAHDLALLTQDVSSAYSGGRSRLEIIDFSRQPQ